MKTIAIAFELISLALVLFAGLSGQPTSGAAAVAVLIAYLAYAWWFKSKEYDDTLHLADRIYFTGYLCTIVGLAGVGWRLGNDTESPNVQTLLHLAGWSLSSTIVGLVGMNLLKARAYSLSKAEPDPIERIAQFLERFEERWKESELARAQAFVDAINASGFSRTLEDLARNLAGGSERLGILKQLSVSTTESVLTLQASIAQLRDSIQPLAKALSARKPEIDSLADFASALSSISKDLSKITSTLSDLNSALKDCKAGIEANATSGLTYAESVRAIDAVLTDFVKITKLRLEHENHEP